MGEGKPFPSDYLYEGEIFLSPRKTPGERACARGKGHTPFPKGKGVCNRIEGGGSWEATEAEMPGVGASCQDCFCSGGAITCLYPRVVSSLDPVSGLV